MTDHAPITAADAPELPYITLAHSADREVWMRHRMRGVGASEVACVLGEDPYMEPEDLARIKRGECTDEDLRAERQQNSKVDIARASRMGQLLESFVAAEYARETHAIVEPWGHLLQDREEPLLLATPDYQEHTADGVELIECKATAAFWRTTAKYEGMPPLSLQLQLQAQLAVTGLQRGKLAWVQKTTCEVDWETFERHEGVIRRIREAVRSFWEEEVQR